MRINRLRRLASACRLSLPFFIVATFSGSPARAASLTADDPTVRGVVVDQSGQPLPRTYVRAIDSTGRATATTFTDESGRFRLTPALAGCRLDVSLSGFTPALVSCSATDPLVVVLQVGPIEERVVVTATRTEAPADQVGASVTTFTAEDLARRATPLVADLLRTSPGAMVVRSGGAGTVTSLFVRGGDSSYNKVLLDGIPLNEPGGTFNFSNLMTDNLERVEIVRGAHSALFGSDAMASVVQLFTKRPDRSDERPHGMATLEGGTYGTLHGTAAISAATGRVDYSFGVSQFATDNRAANNAFTNTTLSAGVGVRLSESATLRFIGRGELGHTGTPGATAFGRPDLDAFFQRHDGTGGVSFDQQIGGSFRQRAAYSVAASNQQSTNLTLDPPFTPQFDGRTAPFEFSDFLFDSRTNLRRHHADYQADWRLSTDAAHGDHRLTLLVDWDGERATLENRLDGGAIRAERDNFGGSIQHQVLWPRTFVTLGARIERNGSFGDAVVPRGSVVFVARRSSGAIGETRLKASAGLGIKEPTVLQSFSLSPFFMGNPNLAPERSRTVDAGVEQRMAGDRARIDATWFDNRFKNQISLRTTNPATFEAQYWNIGLSRARGLELGIEAAPVTSLRARAAYTFLASEVLESTAPDDVVFRQGQQLFRRPRHSASIGLSWNRQRVTATLNGIFIGRFVDSDFVLLDPPLVSNPGYTTWDARLSYRLSLHLTALVSIDNATNREYMEPLGYPALRRAVRAGLHVDF